jgi:hypothetical protein
MILVHEIVFQTKYLASFLLHLFIEFNINEENEFY